MSKARHHEDEVIGGAHCDNDKITVDRKTFSAALIKLNASRLATEQKPILPTTDAERKKLPIFEGVVMYFPDALLSVAEVSRVGNDQHNPGQPLGWSKDKSANHYDTGLRHQIDHRTGTRYDTDGTRHLAKAAWRALAALQTDIENERNGK